MSRAPAVLGYARLVVACAAKVAPPQAAAPSAAAAPAAAAPPPISSPPPPPAPAAPSAAAPAAERSALLEHELGAGRPSEAVQRELDSFGESYPPLPLLRRLPDFLSVNAALALLPDPDQREALREQLHAQLEGAPEGPLRGAFLDEQQRLQALWIGGFLVDVLAIYDGSRLTGKLVGMRGTPRLGDVLAESDEARQEILIERVDSTSVCCLPLSLEVVRVSKHGALTRVLRHPRGHAHVGPGVRYDFLNHFEFDRDRVLVTPVVPAAAPGVVYELVFDRASRRYQPTAATRRLMAEDEERAKSGESY